MRGFAAGPTPAARRKSLSDTGPNAVSEAR